MESLSLDQAIFSIAESADEYDAYIGDFCEELAGERSSQRSFF
jgi:hypothetical protein